jgi:hypothetical protein
MAGAKPPPVGSLSELLEQLAALEQAAELVERVLASTPPGRQRRRAERQLREARAQLESLGSMRL